MTLRETTKKVWDILLWIAFAALAAAFIACARANFPEIQKIADSFDANWNYLINNYRSLGLEFGRDIVHIWGPAGFLLSPHWVQSHYIASAAGSLFLHIVIVAVLLTFAIKKRLRAAPLVIMAAGIWFLTGTLFEPLIYAAALLVIIADLQFPRHGWFIISSVIYGTLMFSKFNVFLALTALGVLHLAFCVWGVKMPRRAVLVRAIFAAGGAAIACFMLFPSVGAILNWIGCGFELAGGNSMSLALRSSQVPLPKAVGVIIAVILMGVWIFIRDRKWGVMWFMLAGVLTFFEFKHGFVRADGHIFYFFRAMPVLAASGLLLVTDRRTLITAAVIIFLCCIGPIRGGTRKDYQFISPVGAVRNIKCIAIKSLRKPSKYVTPLLRQRLENLNTGYLSEDIKNRIAGKTVDFMPWEIACVYGTQAKLAPGPYSQYSLIRTTNSDDAMAKHLSDQDVPQMLVMRYLDFDGRNLMHTAPHTLESLLNNYHIAGGDEKVLLLERGARREFYRTPLNTIIARWNQPIPLPPSPHMIGVSIKAELNLPGQMAKCFYAVAPTYIRIPDRGEPRVLTATAPNGLLIKGLPASTREFRSLMETGYTGEQSMAAESFELVMSHPKKYFKDTFEVTFYELQSRQLQAANPEAPGKENK